MNLQFYIQKIKDSELFKDFIKENPEAFICSGFFVIDKQGIDNKQHIDYFIPSQRKIYSFQIEDEIKKVPLETISKENPLKISLDYDIDFDKIEDMIFKEMVKKGIKNKVQKIILSLQKLEKKDFLIGTVFISGMGIIKTNIDIKENKITDFEKKSFFNMVKVIGNKKKD